MITKTQPYIINAIKFKNLIFFISCFFFFSAVLKAGSRTDTKAAIWEKNGFTNYQVDEFSAKELGLNASELYTIKLEVLYIKGSGWNLAEVKNYISNGFKVLSQCKVGIKSVRFHGVDSFKKSLGVAKHPEEDANAISVVNLIKNLPVESNTVRAIFLDNFTDSESTGKSYGFWHEDPINGEAYIHTKLPGSVWFAKRIKEKAYQQRQKALPYDVVAHELMHVLTSLPLHVDPSKYPPNILSTFLSKTRSNYILPKHCELINKNFNGDLINFRLNTVNNANKVTIVGDEIFKDFPNIKKYSDLIWKFIQKRFQLKSTDIPELYFYPFDKEKQSMGFNFWQKQWLLNNYSIWQEWALVHNKRNKEKINLTPQWVRKNIDKNFPFPKGFRALFYTNTNRIQIDPRPKTSAYQNAQKDSLGKIFYTVGHEMLHYALEVKGVPVKIHHCLFVSKLNTKKQSLIDELVEFLILNNISKKAIKIFGPRLEKRIQPCLKLNSSELLQVNKTVKKLFYLKPKN